MTLGFLLWRNRVRIEISYLEKIELCDVVALLLYVVDGRV